MFGWLDSTSNVCTLKFQKGMVFVRSVARAAACLA